MLLLLLHNCRRNGTALCATCCLHLTHFLLRPSFVTWLAYHLPMTLWRCTNMLIIIIISAIALPFVCSHLQMTMPRFLTYSYGSPIEDPSTSYCSCPLWTRLTDKWVSRLVVVSRQPNHCSFSLCAQCNAAAQSGGARRRAWSAAHCYGRRPAHVCLP